MAGERLRVCGSGALICRLLPEPRPLSPALKLRALPWGPFRYPWNKIRADLPQGVLRLVCVAKPCADLHELSEALTASDVHFTRLLGVPEGFKCRPACCLGCTRFLYTEGFWKQKWELGGSNPDRNPGYGTSDKGTSFPHGTLTWDTKSSTSLWGNRERGIQRGGHPPFSLIILSLYL